MGRLGTSMNDSGGVGKVNVRTRGNKGDRSKAEGVREREQGIYIICDRENGNVKSGDWECDTECLGDRKGTQV